MTIGERLKRQFWKMASTLVVPVVAFELLAHQGHHLPNFSLDSFWVWVVDPAPFYLLACIIWSFSQLNDIVCPRCRTWLIVPAMAIAVGRPTRRCPKCRISLNEAVEVAMLRTQAFQKIPVEMTIRECFRRRSFRMQIALGAWVILILVTPRDYNYPVTAVLILLTAIAIAAPRFAPRLYRCPKCSVRLGVAGPLAIKRAYTVSNCPHCGVSFDEPMPG